MSFQWWVSVCIYHIYIYAMHTVRETVTVSLWDDAKAATAQIMQCYFLHFSFFFLLHFFVICSSFIRCLDTENCIRVVLNDDGAIKVVWVGRPMNAAAAAGAGGWCNRTSIRLCERKFCTKTIMFASLVCACDVASSFFASKLCRCCASARNTYYVCLLGRHSAFSDDDEFSGINLWEKRSFTYLTLRRTVQIF